MFDLTLEEECMWAALCLSRQSEGHQIELSDGPSLDFFEQIPLRFVECTLK